MSWIALVAAVCGSAVAPDLHSHITKASVKFDVEPTLILSVIHQESRCIPTALGSSNDTGLMQIVPKWHQERISDLGVTDLFDPYQNILVGTHLLNALNVQDNPIDALVVYNGGYARPKSSYNYAQEVLQKAETYKTLMVGNNE